MNIINYNTTEKTNIYHKKTLWITFVIFLFTSVFLTNIYASEPISKNDILFDKANQAYIEKKYAKSLKFYTEILNNQGQSASLLYNMGNAFYQTGNIGEAVLHYERALILEPNNKQILANLIQVRKKSGLYEDPKPFWLRCFDRLSLNQWTGVTSCFFILFCLSVLGWGIFCTIKKEHISKPAYIPYKPIAIFFVVLFFTGVLGMIMNYQNLSKNVVIINSAKLLVSPFKNAAICTSIKAGRVVYEYKNYGDYLFVKEKNGQSGWIKKSALKSVFENLKSF